MATYVLGDIHGCYEPLRRLLDRVGFDPTVDELWSVGDLVNRGPQSLEVLRFFRQLGTRCTAVLGNHDLHLLGAALGFRPLRPKDTLDEVLRASDLPELVAWLRRLPLAHCDQGVLMVHAGVLPSWTLADALRWAKEAESFLKGDQVAELFSNMCRDGPESFDEDLQGWQRARMVIDVLTRIRFCSPAGQLDLECSDGPEHAPAGMLPWYVHEQRRTRGVPVLFGHWAALRGQTAGNHLFALDTGCVWGFSLTALRLEDKQRLHCECRRARVPRNAR
ncbi:MAG: symmetrical bis(5'-nucleosyl)-tetraphosphatase [Polyangiaceae bacterium]|nr:symmetrical bis(5'-nucleosyl)-tetraphosphatase [Polyangiaceae bacterium]